jgi:uncharacterized protein (TIGR00369 family)
MNSEHYSKLKRMYLQSNVNTQLYPTTECKIELRKATISIALSGKYFHALNAVHGSVYFKLLDDSAFFAVNSIVEDAFVLTTSFTSNLVRPVSSGKIEAIGQVRFESKNLFMAESTLYDEKGNEIAFGSGSFVKSKINLSEEIGYK